MKQILILMAAVMMSLSAAQACAKKAPKAVSEAMPLTVIVTDTTQALLADAEVRIGKTVLRTSFDGKVEIGSELWTSGKTLTIRCKGYKEKKVRVDDALMIVPLTPKAVKATKDYGVRYHTLGGVKALRYDKAEVRLAAAAPMDYMVEAEEMAMPRMTDAVANNASAGLLTAGEVNDFSQWNSWARYLQKAEAYQKIWGMVPQYRYTVQVTNKNGYPLANYPVQLKDKEGNTIFQALTDNTGKAELWGDLTVSGERLAVNGEWKEGLNTIVVDEPCEASDGVDVVFVFDATGSMGDELRYLQAEMKDVIARAKEATGGLDIRTGAVVYRDHGDEYLTRISRLTKDIATTQRFIDKQEANGGGDYPEAVPEALMAALNSAGWDSNARTRVAFLILDAPCHEDSATLALLHEQILNAAALGVRIVPVVCSGIGDSGEYLLRMMALTTNGTSFFLTDDSGIGYTHHKPMTDSLKVEHLNDMMVRTIVTYSLMPDCIGGHWHEEMTEMDDTFVPNPFEIKDLTEEEIAQKDSRTTLYILDISGKLIRVYEGNLEDAGESELARLRLQLSTGVYFIKAFYDGVWHTKKILVH